jgi:hypothetical protein
MRPTQLMLLLLPSVAHCMVRAVPAPLAVHRRLLNHHRYELLARVAGLQRAAAL